MIIIIHNTKKVTAILSGKLKLPQNIVIGDAITKTVLQVSDAFPNELLVWCHEAYKEELNIEKLPNIFHHKRILATYNTSEIEYFPNQIGYIERSYFIKINKNVKFPTWQMSSLVGGVHSLVLQNLKEHLNTKASFDYFLNSIAKRAVVEGLFCYSNPHLLKNKAQQKVESVQASRVELYKFVKQHYKWVWVWFLCLSYTIYENKFTFFSLTKSLFYKQLSTHFNLEEIEVQSHKKVVENREIDVIIPTIGRKTYLYDVLKDLAKQSLLPKNVIIVEQNPEEAAVSELDYLTFETWPFTIKHAFTHQSGVCNARNVALKQIESEWTFLADDDIRFESDLFEESLQKAEQYGITVLNYTCLQDNQKQTYFKTAQTTVFGSGSSMVKSSALKNIKFNMAYEFGFGEDSEFGMQLRNAEHDVIYIPDLKLLHLKAPVGGYRTKVVQLWTNEVPPKPSPTMQLLYQTYYTKEQRLGYKLLLGLRNYKNQTNKNPVKYIKAQKKRWERSVYWSKKLQEKSDA